MGIFTIPCAFEVTEGVKLANALKLDLKKTLRSGISSKTSSDSFIGAEAFLLKEMEGREIEGKLKLGPRSLAEDL